MQAGTVSTCTSPSSLNQVPGIAQSLVLFGVFQVTSILLAISLGVLNKYTGLSPGMYSSIVIEQLVAWPLTIWLAFHWARLPIREAFPLRPFSIRIVPALFLASVGATILLQEIAGWIPFPESLKEFLKEQRAASSAFTLFIPVVMLSPLLEELFFRGQVLRGFLSRYTTTKAVWTSAILFAVFHLNPWQAVAALPLGLFCAWLVLCTGSLLPGMISHATVNFTAFFLMKPLASVFGYNGEQMAAMTHVPPEMLALGAAAMVMGGFGLWRQLSVSVTDSPLIATGLELTDPID